MPLASFISGKYVELYYEAMKGLKERLPQYRREDEETHMFVYEISYPLRNLKKGSKNKQPAIIAGAVNGTWCALYAPHYLSVEDRNYIFSNLLSDAELKDGDQIEVYSSRDYRAVKKCTRGKEVKIIY